MSGAAITPIALLVLSLIANGLLALLCWRLWLDLICGGMGAWPPRLQKTPCQARN